jgi:hypothetical protein
MVSRFSELLRPGGFAEKHDISGAFGIPRIPIHPPARDDRRAFGALARESFDPDVILRYAQSEN